MNAVTEMIIQDIFEHQRSFLPGKRCSPDEVQNHLSLPITIDNLDDEESTLILSTLPKDADSIYLSTMDKGLSGAKVFAARYLLNRRKSKIFVYKIGPRQKLEREYDAIEEYVCPHINSVVLPVFRKGAEKALIAQEFGGLGPHSHLESLRNTARKTDQGKQVIVRLLSERLANWYLNDEQASKVSLKLGQLFEMNLGKNPGEFSYPQNWMKLQDWVLSITGFALPDVSKVVEKVKADSIQSIVTTVHGDLHTQNVLVDEHGACWPIDFAWCRDYSSPIVDLVMLECSLKFLSIPRSAYLNELLQIETLLCTEPLPIIKLEYVPFCNEINNVLQTINAVRTFAFNELGFDFVDYRRSLLLMTYSLATHLGLNRPYVLGSLQILSKIEAEGLSLE